MSKKYTTCLLAPGFKTAELDLTPGQPVSCGDRKIMLAGGFPSLFPDTVFPLSVTLQLNRDLSAMPESMLEEIARAELGRYNRATVKNFRVDPSFVVCVIAADSERLEGFIDTYGGILEIESLLLEDDHPGHAQVTAVEIAERTSGYEIAATVRAPVDLQACTYCGSCGTACPEDCISPALRFDYHRCTFCRECEKVCEENAIDIYGVEKKTIHAPAIIVLGDVKLDLPEERSGIYSETRLAEYFKTLSAMEVEEALQCNNARCHFSGRLGAGCNLCYEQCPAGAIRRDGDGVHVDSLLCTECGTCVAVCPTGAIDYHRFSDDSFIDYFSTLSLNAADALVLGHSDTLHRYWWREKDRSSKNMLFLEYPRIEALSLFHFLHLFSRGARQVVLLVDPRSNLDASCCREAERAGRLLESLFGVADLVRFCSTEELRMFAAPAQRQTIDHVQQQPSVNRRQRLVDLLLDGYRHSGKEITLGREDGAFGTVFCDSSRCTHCFACLNECKVGALRAGDEAHSLLFDAGLCVGCGICVRICPEDALKLGNETVLGPAWLNPIELSRAEPMLCKQCGKEFGTRKGFEKVMKILNSRHMADKGHFEYCDTCRVVKLFESHEQPL